MTSGGNNPATLTAFLLVAVGAALLFAAAYYGHFYGADGRPLTDDAPHPEQVVQDFGERLKQVSLLAPAEDVARAMDEHYGPYVAPDTLAAWKADPSTAPGRLTSSPWPNHIEIATSTELGAREYRVDGAVVELTSMTSLYGGETMGYPVTVHLTRFEDAWRITSFTRVPVSGEHLPEPTPAMVGIYVCLPHKDQSGPQTLECAFGIQAEEGYYALDFSAFTSESGMTIATGERIRVQGALTPLSAIPADDRLHIYDILGVIRVSTLEAL